MMEEIKQKRERIKKIAQERIPDSNRNVAKILLAFSFVCLWFLVLFQFGVLKSKGVFVFTTLLATPIVFSAVSLICLLKKGKGAAFQYIFFFLLAIFWLELELMSGYKSRLLLPVLVMISLRYYNRRFVFFTYFVCLLMLLGSIWCNAYLYEETGFLDLNMVSFDTPQSTVLDHFLYNNIILLKPDSGMLFCNGVLLSFLPNSLFLTVITVLVLRFMEHNLENIISAEGLAAKEANHRAELSDLKTKVILSRVKPHFVYNTLSSIACLCTDEPIKAKKLTLDFSEYLRNNLDTLNSAENSVCSFEEELEHVKCYLNIELVRFEDRLSVEYDVKATSFPVPALSIQPIVENAVKHGISRKAKGGTVQISSEEAEDCYVITVTDDGVGYDKAESESDGREHIGLANVQKRIELFGGTFFIEGVPGKGTRAVVQIPKTEVLL